MRLKRFFCLAAIAAGIAPSYAMADVTYDFNADDGGFTVLNEGAIEDPWIYDNGLGTWSVGGSTSVGAPTSSGLLTQTYQMNAAGTFDLSFNHRYSIEYDGTRWDGAALRYRVNDGGFEYVDNDLFAVEGYVDVIAGNNALKGFEAFSDLSDGYADGEFITSVVEFGTMNAGDMIQIEFLGAWDEFARGVPDGTVPNWEIDSLSIVGDVTVVPNQPLPPLFVGGEGIIGNDVYTGATSNEVYGGLVEGVPGFRGRIVTFADHSTQLDNHTIAELALEDYEGETALGTYPVVDMAGGNGTYSVNYAYPNGVNDDSMSDFAVQVTADVVIPAGEWTIAFGSDDGGQVTIAGIELTDYTDDNFYDDQIRYEGNRGHGWTRGTFTLTEPLETTLVGSFHERGGGDSFEIAILDEANIDDAPTVDSDWRLLGDGVYGWSVTSTAEELISGEVDVTVPALTYRFDVNGDTGESDKIVADERGIPAYTSTVDIDGSFFQIKSVGTVTSGQSFQIVSADVITGTPTILSSDPNQTWVFDPATGNVCLDSCGGVLLGDFNGDGTVNTGDLDVMVLGDAAFDVTGDGVANSADLTEMVSNIIGTWFGDSNGDGEFSSSDFVAIFTIGKFETGDTAVWSEGDWNLDGYFTTSDFVTAFTEGGFELGPKTAVSAVPEPAGMVLLLTGFLGLMNVRRKK